jgi:hypothetical protein
MTEQAGQRNPEPALIALEERVRALEVRLEAVADAVSVLAHGLEDLPTAEPRGPSAAAAARRAYELLLIAEPRRPAPHG